MVINYHPMEPLDPRKKIILKAVVIEYVTDGEPVGSELIASRYELGVRSATVRNELAEMSELGYLEQPHTSAGRIPSDAGYRYYVDNLMGSPEPDQANKSKIEIASHREDILRAILQETTKTLSRMTHQIAAASTVGATHLKLTGVMITALGPTRAMLVLVFNNADAHNRLVECPPDLTLADFGLLNENLPKLFDGLNVKELSQVKAPASTQKPSLDKFIANILGTVKSIAKEMNQGQIVVEGEEYVAAQPEFQNDRAGLEELLRFVEDEAVMSTVIPNQTEKPVMVTIGRENTQAGLRSLSVLRHSFYLGDKEAGTLAIIGPTRIDYENNLALLKFAANAIGSTIEKITGV